MRAKPAWVPANILGPIPKRRPVICCSPNSPHRQVQEAGGEPPSLARYLQDASLRTCRKDRRHACLGYAQRSWLPPCPFFRTVVAPIAISACNLAIQRDLLFQHIREGVRVVLERSSAPRRRSRRDPAGSRSRRSS